MNKFVKKETNIPDLLVIEPTVFGDARGYFMESYNEKDFYELGITCRFVQDNQSSSTKGVLRGLHYQKHFPQDKLVRVINGEIYDVAVDLRTGSDTFGKTFGIHLSSQNKKQLFIPKGFAHGFLVLSDQAEVLYKCSDFYKPNDEAGIIWNDGTLAIDWPLENMREIILSDKDKCLPAFMDIALDVKNKS